MKFFTCDHFYFFFLYFILIAGLTIHVEGSCIKKNQLCLLRNKNWVSPIKSVLFCQPNPVYKTLLSRVSPIEKRIFFQMKSAFRNGKSSICRKVWGGLVLGAISGPMVQKAIEKIFSQLLKLTVDSPTDPEAHWYHYKDLHIFLKNW